jgi:hypothetical protein
MAEFHHLSDDAFPHLGNVNPYRRKVDFDYGRYDYTATLKLCNVTWPIDYKHVINWASEEARDEYFSSVPGETVELANGFTRVQLDSVMVPVPYDVALTYGYVYMRVPELTPAKPIDYEDAPHVRTICAFVAGCTYHSPSTTELALSVDMWTTYLPHLAINTVLTLHRGHAPAYATSADLYLSNPREHCQNLLTPDVSFGEPDVTAHAELLPIGAGDKMLVFASTIPATRIDTLATSTTASGSSTPAAFYDTGARNGHQVGVRGYEWHYGGRNYAGMRNPTHYTGVGASVPTYATLYAVPASNAQNAFDTWAAKLPQLIKSIQAAYILPKDVLTFADSELTVAGIGVLQVIPAVGLSHLCDLTLSKESFGYPTRYADIAKLYTSPYARLVVSDTFGRELSVRIEDMGPDAGIMQQLSPMAECLRWDVLLTGVASAGNNTYSWRSLADSPLELSLPGTDVARYTLELGIPTYALYLDARASHAADGWYDAQAQRASAINAYQSTMRSANTGKENADDSADTGKANADASANTNVTNTANTGATATANTVIANNLRTSSTTRNNTAANEMKAVNKQNIFNTLYLDDEYTMQASDANLKSEAVAGALSTMGGLVGGGIAGGLTSGLSAIVNISTSMTLSQLSSENIEGKEAVGQAYQDDVVPISTSNATDQTTYQNTAATGTNANNVANANTNAANSAATAKANATRSQGTAKANASYSRGTTEENAKAALELARQNYERTGHAYDMANPDAYGMVTGDASPDALMRRVVQLRIDTQSPGAIARAGDAMLRYGYVFDGLWAVTDWCPTDHDGCYWEATDVLAPAVRFTNPAAERAFEDILNAGTTVWNDPAKIGGVPW